MSEGHHSISLKDEKLHLGDLGGRITLVSGIVGIVALALALVVSFVLEGSEDAPRRFGLAYLTAFGMFLSISVGALFFVVIQHLVRAGWSVVVRRVAEVLAANLIFLAVLLIPILVLLGPIYHHWVHPEPGDVIIEGKAAWLNAPFFVARLLIYMAILIALAWWYWRQSVQQDEHGGTEATYRMQWWSGGAMVVFGLVVTLMPMDLLMTLDAHWYSTIFGVYFFTGGVLGFFAILILMLRFLQRRGLMQQAVTVEHYHDLGKFLFGFTIFWGYIAYSQYMLMWYANIPEAVAWYAHRGATTNPEAQPHGPWQWVALFLLFFHFLIPFLGQLSRWTKRNLGWLSMWAVWMLVAHAVDHYWLVMPELGADGLPLVVELLCFAGVGGLWLAGATWLAGERSLLPVRDPRLEESLALENY